METPVLNIQGKETGKFKLPKEVFGHTADKHLLHEVVKAYLANQRAGTASVKTRAEVSGGGKKPWKQKGTGRARQGSTRSPIWRKGGVAFGPHPRSYEQNLPSAKRRTALKQALSDKFANGKFIVLEDISVSSHKTKELAGILSALSAGKKPLLVSAVKDKNLSLAGGNIKGLSLSAPSDLNTYVVLNSSKIIATKDAVETLSKILGGRK